MNKVAWIVVLVLVLGGGYWWMNKSAAPETPASTTETAGEAGTAPVTPGTPAASAQTVTIVWKNDAFTPANVEIKMGDSVMFKNEGAKDFNLESNPHPTHTGFTGLNVGVIAPGKSSTVVFPTAGSFSYHNHMNPTVGGMITVK